MSTYVDTPPRELIEIAQTLRLAIIAAEKECRRIHSEYDIAVAIYDKLCARMETVQDAIAHRAKETV